MKFHGDRKYLYWGLTFFSVICGALLVYYCLFYGSKISSIFNHICEICFPIFVGIFLAYLVTPVINSIEYRILIPLYIKIRKEKSKTEKHRKLFRVIAIISAYIIIFLCIYGLFAMIIPEISTSITSIAGQFPQTFNKYYDLFINFINKNDAISKFLRDTLSFDINSFDSEQLLNLIVNQLQNIGSLLTTLSTTVVSALMTTLYVLVGIIISFYLIYDKEKFAAQAKKLCYSIFEMHNANQLIKDCRFIHKTFIGFISGKIFDSIIIGILCFIGSTLIGLHYPILISVIVGVTNVIPFFGPWLGAIPCTLLLLVVNPIEALYFIFFILFLQQLDGNVIGPKILGDSTGISGFWVIFAITFFGGVFGVAGMFIGVPVFAVLYAFARRFVNRKLKAKNLPRDSEQYKDVYEIRDQEFITKEHLYTEIKNPKARKKQSDIQEDGRYHLFRFLQKTDKESSDDNGISAKERLSSILHPHAAQQETDDATAQNDDNKDTNTEDTSKKS